MSPWPTRSANCPRKCPAHFGFRHPREGAGVQPPIPARYDAIHYDPSHALLDQLAAVSVGIVDGEARLDLDYFDDSRAAVDMNVAYTRGGKFVEIQGSAENGEGFDRSQMTAMTDLAVRGCEQIMEIQREALTTVAVGRG